jgi:hypothetical protein
MWVFIDFRNTKRQVPLSGRPVIYCNLVTGYKNEIYALQALYCVANLLRTRGVNILSRFVDSKSAAAYVFYAFAYSVQLLGKVSDEG